jgi:hypothetical protein
MNQSNAFKICKFHMFHKSCNEFQQNQMMEKQKGSLLELFQKIFLESIIDGR